MSSVHWHLSRCAHSLTMASRSCPESTAHRSIVRSSHRGHREGLDPARTGPAQATLSPARPRRMPARGPLPARACRHVPLSRQRRRLEDVARGTGVGSRFVRGCRVALFGKDGDTPVPKRGRRRWVLRDFRRSQQRSGRRRGVGGMRLHIPASRRWAGVYTRTNVRLVDQISRMKRRVMSYNAP